MNTDLETRFARLHHGIVDMHFDLLMDLYERRERANVLDTDYLADLQAGGIGVIGAAIYIEDKYVPELALRVALDQIARLYVETAHNTRFALCKSYADVVTTRHAGKFVGKLEEGVQAAIIDKNGGVIVTPPFSFSLTPHIARFTFHAPPFAPTSPVASPRATPCPARRPRQATVVDCSAMPY